jgi:hypothetical protein
MCPAAAAHAGRAPGQGKEALVLEDEALRRERVDVELADALDVNWAAVL